MTSKAIGARSAPVKRWQDVDWIVWGDDLAGIPPARWLAKYAKGVEPVLKTSHMAAQVAAVREGVGVALLPLTYTRVEAVMSIRCSRALQPSLAELPFNETWLVGHKALRGVPRVAAVWDFFVEEFGQFDRAP
jgi:DNA-binding transcriptional LysR family regulator